MRSLSSYNEGSGNWLPDGWHRVTVTGYDMTGPSKVGNYGVEFEVVNHNQLKQRVTCWLTDKALWRLNWFAAACGLSEDERDNYDVDDNGSHRLLIGREVKVLVARKMSDPKYGEVVDFQKIAISPTPQEPTASTPLTATASEPQYKIGHTPPNSDRMPF